MGGEEEKNHKKKKPNQKRERERDRERQRNSTKVAGQDSFDDHLYSTILHSLEQTHCARLWFYTSDKLFL